MTRRYQQGLSLVELLISISLGMFVVLAICGLVISSKTAHSIHIDANQIQDTARFALNNLGRTIKQAGHSNFDSNDVRPIFLEQLTPNLVGFDAGNLNTNWWKFALPNNASDTSDVLVLRFFGAASSADNTILNCAGSGVPAVTKQTEAEKNRGWSIYYVANDVDNEPALFCKYDGPSGFVSQAIARGVEAFQVLYGIRSGTSIQFLNATQISELDSSIPAEQLNQRTHWKKITAIKVAMLIRGLADSSSPSSSTSPSLYHLFGENYVNASDQGTLINESDIHLSQRERLRKVVEATIQLRNSMS